MLNAQVNNCLTIHPADTEQHEHSFEGPTFDGNFFAKFPSKKNAILEKDFFVFDMLTVLASVASTYLKASGSDVQKLHTVLCGAVGTIFLFSIYGAKNIFFSGTQRTDS